MLLPGVVTTLEPKLESNFFVASGADSGMTISFFKLSILEIQAIAIPVFPDDASIIVWSLRNSPLLSA